MTSAKASLALAGARVPHEPYKAAVVNIMATGTSTGEQQQQQQQQQQPMPPRLIRYKIDTDLDAFNMRQEASDDILARRHLTRHSTTRLADLATGNESNGLTAAAVAAANITGQSVTNGTSSSSSSNGHMSSGGSSHRLLPPNFVDARLYTDVHFFELANQLKNKSATSAAASSSSSSSSAIASSKPVQVVGPLIDSSQRSSSFSSSSSSSATFVLAPSESKAHTPTGNLTHQQQYHQEQVSYLQEQMRGINEQLQIQTQVNMELKKLLVASMGGEDIEYKLERLVNDKQRYEFELAANGKLIETLRDDVEQIAIQCDMWRSKFLASKLLAEENATWKSFLLLLSMQNENVTNVRRRSFTLLKLTWQFLLLLSKLVVFYKKLCFSTTKTGLV